MIVEIPTSIIDRLQGLGPHFCLVEGKNPNVGGKGWQLPEKLMLANDPRLEEHLKRGGNYGVVGGGGLIIIEADDPKIQECIQEKLPATFTVKSGGRGLPHYYFLCSIEKNRPLIDPENENENIGHIKAEGGMVVGPNSVHPSGRRYEIVNNGPLAQVRKDTLLSALKPYLIPDEQILRVEIAASSEKRRVDLNILDVVPLSGLRRHGNEYFGSHPVHGSTTKQNFHVNPSKNCWHCFRCESGGGPLLWLAVEEGLIDCPDARVGALRGKVFWDAIRIAEERGLMRARAYIGVKDLEDVKNKRKKYATVFMLKEGVKPNFKTRDQKRREAQMDL